MKNLWENIKQNLKDPEFLQIVVMVILTILVIESALLWALKPRIVNVDDSQEFNTYNNQTYVTEIIEATEPVGSIDIETKGQCILVQPVNDSEAVMRCMLT